MSIRLQRIVSGGQTGADRAALDFALAHHIPHGGWCPRGRRTEDGPIPTRYRLTETPSPDPAQRTEWNLRDSDGTVILSIAPTLTSGSQLTAEFARQYRKPLLHLSRRKDGTAAARRLSHFLRRNHIRVLNLAGPRRSEEPPIGRFVRTILESALSRVWAGGDHR